MSGVVIHESSPSMTSECKTPVESLFSKVRDLRGRSRQEVLGRIRKFLRKRGNARSTNYAMQVIEQRGRSDADTLHQLLRTLIALIPIAPAAPVAPTDGRSMSRLKDVEHELKLVAAAIGNNCTYIDIGCSEGSITEAIAKTLGLSPDKALACDPVNQEPNDAFTFTQSDGNSLPYEDGTADVTTMFMSAHHFADATRMFEEANRVTKPGGFLLMREHNIPFPAMSVYYDVAHALYACVFGIEQTPEEFVAQYSEGEYAYYRSDKEWVSLAALHGFHPCTTPHGPYYNGKEVRDQFDSFYILFSKRDEGAP